MLFVASGFSQLRGYLLESFRPNITLVLLDLGGGGASHSGGLGRVQCDQQNAVVLIQPVRECSGTAYTRGGEAIAESQIFSESQFPNVNLQFYKPKVKF